MPPQQPQQPIQPQQQPNQPTSQPGSQPVQPTAQPTTQPQAAAQPQQQPGPVNKTPTPDLSQVTNNMPPTNPNTHPLAPPRKTSNKKGSGSKKTHKDDNTAQKSLLISEIRDGMVVMKDGSLRAVVMCQSINFDLMSPEEREAVEFSYQGFLNSLYFPVQIFIRSKHVNLDSYMEKLTEVRRNQDNILLGLLMEDYINYVRYLIEAANIMDKQFYVVVPYFPPALSEISLASGAQKFSEVFKPKEKDVVTINENDFTKYKQELTQQVRMVVGGMNQMGVNAIPLNTQELIELYYNAYNPVTAKQQPLADINQLDAPIIGKGDGDAETILPGGRI
ncbi:MAG: hypothetical protein WD061_03030 [Candidatus Saccharimonadales bacterium]